MPCSVPPASLTQIYRCDSHTYETHHGNVDFSVMHFFHHLHVLHVVSLVHVVSSFTHQTSRYLFVIFYLEINLQYSCDISRCVRPKPWNATHRTHHFVQGGSSIYVLGFPLNFRSVHFLCIPFSSFFGVYISLLFSFVLYSLAIPHHCNTLYHNTLRVWD